MNGWLDIAGARREMVQSELHVISHEEGCWIYLHTMVTPEGGFAFWDVKLSLLKNLNELAGQRVHIKRNCERFSDDTLGTDYVGVDDVTDLNYWTIDGESFNWGEIQIDFQKNGADQILVIVFARLTDGDIDDEDMELENYPLVGCAEFTITPDDRDPFGYGSE